MSDMDDYNNDFNESIDTFIIYGFSIYQHENISVAMVLIEFSGQIAAGTLFRISYTAKTVLGIVTTYLAVLGLGKNKTALEINNTPKKNTTSLFLKLSDI